MEIDTFVPHASYSNAKISGIPLLIPSLIEAEEKRCFCCPCSSVRGRVCLSVGLSVGRSVGHVNV